MTIHTDTTLDPPGRVIVMGTTPLGLEAALYGRYLGYDVTVIAGVDAWRRRHGDGKREPDEGANRIGPRLNGDWFDRHWPGRRSPGDLLDQPMPMMPDRCLSSLARAAIAAQDDADVVRPLPITMRQWIDGSLIRLTQTDLLRGRVHDDWLVESIDLAPVDAEDSDEAIPPDFHLNLRLDHGGTVDVPDTTAECIIVADIPVDGIAISFPRPIEYWFEIITSETSNAEEMLRDGYRQITAIYAQLGGRADLDLYRPLRL